MEPTPEQILGQYLARARAYIGMSQTELALEAGCSPQMVYMVESGRSMPKLRLFTRLCDALCVPADEALDAFRRAEPAGRDEG